ncbi:LysR substrate-binding domain-containing protein [Marinomonas mediterranea]|jgi:transcriptional regulator, LysR family|uniref:Transcriptional regulator, LysR family n=2 Tax=Marinomonas mediterranea TaxID=119864 RepID=F2JZ86_MARM1|nr:LysR substrate-binding domain-containing protein [Marinomonas mediterranea]AAV49995.1 putative LysR-type transcriptional regulator [Marinomonas mediterranea]ADZ93171.1 transcriptional regulator, LysR family [Marinomonas mediterranea MMB-1]WCN11072.1 LysR family transcriptional regulator [Marinomonas mediterranea]WCN15132.1 LysR family transcriptional regulator [Marinomonas mediterranea]WCN19175.1 LysR family transcriptional regulator [Marinomonas mediterranea MMB-1]
MNQKVLPPLNWLRAFEVSARHLNFTHAAAELCLTQGAVSQQIRLLEDHLGIPLFKRLPRGLSLTSEGQSYLPVVQDAISRLAAATSELVNKDAHKPIKIHGSLSFFVHWLAPKLTDFKLRYPNIDIRYTTSLWVDEVDDDHELEIRWGNGDWPGLVVRRLTWDTLFPVCAPSLLDTIDTPSDLAAQTLLHTIGYEEGWGYWLSMVGEQTVDPAKGMQVDTLLAALRMAELGLGVALARSSMAEDLIAEGKLVELFDKRLNASESFYLVHKTGTELSDDVNVFLEWLGK